MYRKAVELRRMASNGAGFIVLADTYTVKELTGIASCVRAGVSMTIRNAGRLSAEEAIGIAKAGPGTVIFDFTPMETVRIVPPGDAV